MAALELSQGDFIPCSLFPLKAHSQRDLHTSHTEVLRCGRGWGGVLENTDLPLSPASCAPLSRPGYVKSAWAVYYMHCLSIYVLLWMHVALRWSACVWLGVFRTCHHSDCWVIACLEPWNKRQALMEWTLWYGLKRSGCCRSHFSITLHVSCSTSKLCCKRTQTYTVHALTLIVPPTHSRKQHANVCMFMLCFLLQENSARQWKYLLFRGLLLLRRHRLSQWVVTDSIVIDFLPLLQTLMQHYETHLFITKVKVKLL